MFHSGWWNDFLNTDQHNTQHNNTDYRSKEGKRKRRRRRKRKMRMKMKMKMRILKRVFVEIEKRRYRRIWRNHRKNWEKNWIEEFWRYREVRRLEELNLEVFAKVQEYARWKRKFHWVLEDMHRWLIVEHKLNRENQIEILIEVRF